jgi:hypothetical protein
MAATDTCFTANSRFKRGKPALRWAAGLLCLAIACPACFRGSLFPAVVATALVTAVVVSSIPPPPPREVYVHVERPGSVWQSGYWVRQHDEWVWIPGRWVPEEPGQTWLPDHWEAQSDGTWRFVAGRWAPAGPVPPPPASPPPSPPPQTLPTPG